MPKFKRALVPGEYLTAADMLDIISQQRISAAAVQGLILLAAQPPMAWLLDCCCFGKVVAQDLAIFDLRRPTRAGSQPSGDDGGLNASGTAIAALEVVAGGAGVNVASEELEQQFQQHLQEVLARRQRRGRQTPQYSSSSAAASDTAAAAAAGACAAMITSATTSLDVLQCQQDWPQRQKKQQQKGQQAAAEASAQIVGCMLSASDAAAAASAAAELGAAQSGANQAACGSTASGCMQALGTAPPAPAAFDPSVSSHTAVAVASSNGYISGQLQLVQLSSQEAFFLMHVLHCCQITAIDMAGRASNLDPCLAMEQPHPQQHSCQNDGSGQEAGQQQQHQQPQHHNGHLLQVPQHQICHGSQILSAEQLWQWCCENSSGDALTFVSQYAAYHHFRSKGWIPQPGLSFGADFVLYELHPEYAHSDYAVLVMTQVQEPVLAEGTGWPPSDNCTALPLESTKHVAGVSALAGVSASRGVHQGNVDMQHQQDIPSSSSGSSTGDDSSGSRHLPTYSSSELKWLDAHIMQRLARQVLKQLLLFYVVLPQGLPLESPSCLQQLSVREVLMQRWQPSAAGNRGFK